MNLIELFDSLLPVEQNLNEKKFNAIQIPDFPNFRIGIDIEKNPVLLLSVANSRGSNLKNIKLRYLQLNHNVECKIFDGKKTSFDTLTTITFTAVDRNLQEHFLRISETLVKGIGMDLTQKSAVDTINRFVEIFRSLSDSPTKTINGLWAELFLIDCAANTEQLLYYWHANFEEKFDFNSGLEKIEVKSNSGFERIHIFSSEQLNPPVGTNVIVASVFIKKNNAGQSIQQLIDSITSKTTDISLIEKLNTITYKALGNAFQEGSSVKFDYHIAKDSLKFYRAEDIGRIKETYIPNEVTEVKFKSDLSRILPFNVNDLEEKGMLFNAL